MKFTYTLRDVARFLRDCRMLWTRRKSGERLVLVSWLPNWQGEWVTLIHRTPAGESRIVRLWRNGSGANGELRGYDIRESYTVSALTPCLCRHGIDLRLRFRRARKIISNGWMLWTNREPGERLTTIGQAHRGRGVCGIRLVSMSRDHWKSQLSGIRDLRSSKNWHGRFDYHVSGETADSHCGRFEPCLILKRTP